jgi:hypothetical protein
VELSCCLQCLLEVEAGVVADRSSVGHEERTPFLSVSFVVVNALVLMCSVSVSSAGSDVDRRDRVRGVAGHLEQDARTAVADAGAEASLVERLDQGVPVLVARDQLEPTEGGVLVLPQTDGVADVVGTSGDQTRDVARRDVVLLDDVPGAVGADLTGDVAAEEPRRTDQWRRARRPRRRSSGRSG